MRADAVDLMVVSAACYATSDASRGATDALSAPACISSTVSVGATTKRDAVSAFSTAPAS